MNGRSNEVKAINFIWLVCFYFFKRSSCMQNFLRGEKSWIDGRSLFDERRNLNPKWYLCNFLYRYWLLQYFRTNIVADLEKLAHWRWGEKISCYRMHSASLSIKAMIVERNRNLRFHLHSLDSTESEMRTYKTLFMHSLILTWNH